MGVFVYKGIPGHGLPLVVVVLGEHFVLECGLTKEKANEQEDTHGDGVGEEGLVPGLLHIRTILHKNNSTLLVF